MEAAKNKGTTKQFASKDNVRPMHIDLFQFSSNFL